MNTYDHVHVSRDPLGEGDKVTVWIGRAALEGVCDDIEEVNYFLAEIGDAVTPLLPGGPADDGTDQDRRTAAAIAALIARSTRQVARGQGDRLDVIANRLRCALMDLDKHEADCAKAREERAAQDKARRIADVTRKMEEAE